MNFPLPAFDPLLSLPQDDQFNIDAASAGAIFDLSASAPHMGSANSPPGELELDIDAFSHHFAGVGEQPVLHLPADELASMLDMPELHETIEDRAVEAGLPSPGVAQGSSLESFAAFVNSHPTDALSLADPNFYANLGRQILTQYPHIAAALFPHNVGVAPPQYIADSAREKASSWPTTIWPGWAAYSSVGAAGSADGSDASCVGTKELKSNGVESGSAWSPGA